MEKQEETTVVTKNKKKIADNPPMCPPDTPDKYIEQSPFLVGTYKIIRAVAIRLFLLFLIFTFAIQWFVLPEDNMYPTMQKNDIVIAVRYPKTLQRG